MAPGGVVVGDAVVSSVVVGDVSAVVSVVWASTAGGTATKTTKSSS